MANFRLSQFLRENEKISAPAKALLQALFGRRFEKTEIHNLNGGKEVKKQGDSFTSLEKMDLIAAVRSQKNHWNGDRPQSGDCLARKGKNGCEDIAGNSIVLLSQNSESGHGCKLADVNQVKKNQITGCNATEFKIRTRSFDQAVLAGIFEDLDQASARDLLCKFQHDLEVGIEQFHVAAKYKDISHLERVSHSLKGLTGVFGAKKLANKMEAINNRIKIQEEFPNPVVLKEAFAECSQAMACLQRLKYRMGFEVSNLEDQKN